MKIELKNYGKKLWQTEHVQRFVKFGIVGGSGVLVNMGLLWLFTEVVGLFYIISSVLAIAFAMDDEVTPAKGIALFAKKNEAIEILGGILERKFIDEEMVKKLAALPTKEQLIAKMVGTISAPISGMMNVFAGNIRGLVNVLNAHKDTLNPEMKN